MKLLGSLEFPSPYGVSFILISIETPIPEVSMGMFPSPYGVSFILICVLKSGYIYRLGKKFPSPYGVSFILINLFLRLNKKEIEFPSPYGVSFILIRNVF